MTAQAPTDPSTPDAIPSEGQAPVAAPVVDREQPSAIPAPATAVDGATPAGPRVPATKEPVRLRTVGGRVVGVPVFAPTGLEAEVIVPDTDPRDGIEGTVTASDGTILRTLRWLPQQTAWANVLLVHGLAEHSGRYRHVGRQLAAAGLDVFAYDHRGFGGSAGPRTYVDRWSRLHDDLEARIEAIRAASELPLVLYGHSMGGLVVLGYILSTPHRPQPDRVVLSAPGIDSTIPRWRFDLARTFSPILPKLRVANGFARGSLSRDPAVEARYFADPLVQPKTTLRFATLADAEQQRVKAILNGPGRLPVTTYVIHGTADQVVPVRATETLQGRPNVTRHIYRDLRHELHNEPEGPVIYAALVEWLRGELHRPAV